MSHIAGNVNIDNYLALNKYNVDEKKPHIVLAPSIDESEFDKLIRVCPAGLYKRRKDGEKVFDHSGCLECGTCRIVCGDAGIDIWRFPAPSCGIEYRYG